MKQDTLAGELESLMRARQACKTEAAADTMTHEIGLLVCGHPNTILAALRTDGEANSRAVPSGEAVELCLIERMARAMFDVSSCPYLWDDIPDLREGFLKYAQAAWSCAAREMLDGADALAALSASKPDDASALLKEAAAALLADVRARYPGEELRCQYMRALDAALISIERDGA